MQASSRLNYCCDSEIIMSIKNILRSNILYYIIIHNNICVLLVQSYSTALLVSLIICL